MTLLERRVRTYFEYEAQLIRMVRFNFCSVRVEASTLRHVQ